jgi:hypothetical protein
MILLCLALNVVWMVSCSQLASSSWKTAAALIAATLGVIGGLVTLAAFVITYRLIG